VVFLVYPLYLENACEAAFYLLTLSTLAEKKNYMQHERDLHPGPFLQSSSVERCSQGVAELGESFEHPKKLMVVQLWAAALNIVLQVDASKAGVESIGNYWGFRETLRVAQ